MLNYRSAKEVWVDVCSTLLNPPRGVPLPWWPTLTEMLGGMRPHELTLLCAPTGAGKTQLLANLAAQLLIANENIYSAPVETGDVDFLTRIVSAADANDLNDGRAITMDKLDQVNNKWLEPLIKKNLFISTHDNRVGIEEMVNTLKYMQSGHGVSVAILDNLNFFLKVVSSDKEKMEMDNSIHEFVILAKKIPMHIILIVHPRKTLDGRVESEFDIKGSSTAVQEAANVILFNRPKKEDIESGKRYSTDREMIFRKIRKRGIYVGRSLWFDFKNGRYQELVGSYP